ncbi:MAG TPA: alpha/beta hydrolase [Kofleriaceae bacterium]|nr:alpha/beta hydrolase [Kofleriaceae bacterium]
MRSAAVVLVALTAVASAKPARWQTLTPPTATMPTAASTGFVERDGASLYYATYGDAKNPPVVLLHGGMGNSDHWVLQIPALTDKLYVIAIDSRGQGRSTRTKAKPSYDLMADDVLAVLDKLEVKHAAFVGWSDGGEIALKLGIHHPDRVDKLFVMGANYDANGSKPRSGKPSQTFATYSARCRKDYAKLSKTPKQFDQLTQWLLPIWKNPMGFTKDQLKQIKAPTVIADGDHDEIIKLSQLEEMAKLIPNAKLRVFADTSHFVLWQDTESLNAALVEFLTAN